MIRREILMTCAFLCLGSWAWAKVTFSDLRDQAYDFYKQGHYAKAAEATEEALKIVEREYGPESLPAAEFLGNLGALKHLLGKEEEAQALLSKARTIREENGVTGVPLGIQTEAFFTEVAKEKGRNMQEHPGSVQEVSNVPLCDLDGDRDCDEEDRAVCKKAMGHCNDPLYAEYASRCDINFDNCINDKDDEMLFSENGLLGSWKKTKEGAVK